MGVFQAGYGVGVRDYAREEERSAPSNNHFSNKLTRETNQKIASLGLVRVAGNSFLCPSTKDIWQVQANGSIMRLTADEVNQGEHLAGAPAEAPADFLGQIMGDLTF